jgi:hypothetical protein
MPFSEAGQKALPRHLAGFTQKHFCQLDIGDGIDLRRVRSFNASRVTLAW